MQTQNFTMPNNMTFITISASWVRKLLLIGLLCLCRQNSLMNRLLSFYFFFFSFTQSYCCSCIHCMCFWQLFFTNHLPWSACTAHAVYSVVSAGSACNHIHSTAQEKKIEGGNRTCCLGCKFSDLQSKLVTFFSFDLVSTYWQTSDECTVISLL